VPSFTTETVAPLTEAPEVSLTVPKIAPASTCACAGELVKNIISAATANVRDARRINTDTGVLLIAFLLRHSGPTASSTSVYRKASPPAERSSAERKRNNAALEQTAPAAKKQR
jgi:hypothetical protein